MTEQTQENQATDPKPTEVLLPKTRKPQAPKRPRREVLTERYNKLFEQRKEIDEELTQIVAEVQAIDDLNNIQVGTVVLFKQGKGDTAAEVEGVIEGVRDSEDGTRQFKVTFGQGFDRDVAVLKSDRVRVKPAEVAEDAAA